jgi:hypothetical protein
MVFETIVLLSSSHEECPRIQETGSLYRSFSQAPAPPVAHFLKGENGCEVLDQVPRPVSGSTRMDFRGPVKSWLINEGVELFSKCILNHGLLPARGAALNEAQIN